MCNSAVCVVQIHSYSTRYIVKDRIYDRWGGIIICLLLSQLSDLDRPTEDCSRHVTYRVGVIAVSSIIGLLVVMGAVLIIAFCLYKMYKTRQRTKRLANMPEEERKRLQNDIKEFQKDLIKVLGNPSLDKNARTEVVEQIKKNLEATRGRLAGDGENEE